MLPLFFDIETAPPSDPAVQSYIREHLTPPKNYVKEEAKTKWLAENLEAKVKQAAVDPIMGEIISMAWAFGASDVRCLVRNLQEEEQNFLTRSTSHLWADWNTVLKSNKPRDKTRRYPVRYVGHNVLFDLRVIHFRTKLWGVHWPFEWPEKWQPWDKAIADTMRMAEPDTHCFVSLDRLAFAMLGERKMNLEDRQAFEFWQERDYDTVNRYNIQDVKLTRKLYTKLAY
jgi:hypothetical protein